MLLAFLTLAGIPLSARARVQTKCLEGDLAEVELMREDALASSRREGQAHKSRHLRVGMELGALASTAAGPGLPLGVPQPRAQASRVRRC